MYIYRDKLLCDGCAAATVLARLLHPEEANPVDLRAALAIIAHGLTSCCESGLANWLPDQFPVLIPNDSANVLDKCGQCQSPLREAITDCERQ